MERLPAVSLCRFGFEVVPDADGVRQRPADRDAEPDARAPSGVAESRQASATRVPSEAMVRMTDIMGLLTAR